LRQGPCRFFAAQRSIVEAHFRNDNNEQRLT
jgi:hypothetical protein